MKVEGGNGDGTSAVARFKKGRVVYKKEVAYPNDNQVWVKEDYDRKEKGFWCSRFSDIGDCQLIKATKTVYTDFIF